MGVSILPSERGPWDLIGSAINRNVSQVLPGAVQQGYNRGQLQQSLGKISELAQNPNSSNLDVLLSAMQAGAGIPGSERYLGAIIPELMKSVEAKRSQNLPLPGETGQQPRDREPIQQPQQGQALPGFMGQQPQKQTGQFFPTNIGPQGGPGQAPQAATTGIKAPLRSRDEKMNDARKLANDLTKGGQPTTLPQALEMINADEEDKKVHNAEVDKELGQRVKSQQTYGERAVDYLKKVFPEKNPPTPEMEAIFQKKGEEASKLGESEADINRYLAKEANKFRNAIVNVEKDLDAPRFHNALIRMPQGTYKNMEDSAADLRNNLKPLLDLGLFDTARNLLEKKNFGLEEREAILHPLSPQSSSLANQLPEIDPFMPSQKFQRRPESLQGMKDTLKQIKQVDPDFSPVLVRKSFEDKGYDWRSFKDAWNELQQEGFELSDDQRIQSGNLDTPPLTLLDQIFHGLNLIGR